jgi:hypothetical protein
MALQITSESHLDHNLSPAHVAWLLARFADRDAFFIETLTLPDDLGEVECGIYGPSVGDEPVPEAEVSYAIRGARRCASRMVKRPVRMTRTLTVIAGPNDGLTCVLYTSYGGPAAPREPGDTGIPTWEEVQAARAFWAEHALAQS